MRKRGFCARKLYKNASKYDIREKPDFAINSHLPPNSPRKNVIFYLETVKRRSGTYYMHYFFFFAFFKRFKQLRFGFEEILRVRLNIADGKQK